MNTAISTLPEHFDLFGGDLFDNRTAPAPVVRRDYSRQFSTIAKLSEVKATLRAGSIAWPGCYPLHFITRDGAALCFDCTRKEFRQVAWDFLNDCSTGWRITGCQVNWEDQELTCDHCSKQIESAYGE